MSLNYTSSELIQIGVPARNWEEAIRLSAEPLVKHGICLPEYVDDMVLNVIAGSNMRPKDYYRIWQYTKLKCYYKLSDRQV